MKIAENTPRIEHSFITLALGHQSWSLFKQGRPEFVGSLAFAGEEKQATLNGSKSRAHPTHACWSRVFLAMNLWHSPTAGEVNFRNHPAGSRSLGRDTSP